MSESVVIVAAKRTPIGKFGGQLASLSAVDLGVIATKAVIEASSLSSSRIDQVIFGNVVQAGSGQNVARQIEINSGIPVESTATTVNEVCGSGMKAIRMGEAALLLGDANVVIVGGTESMSNAPYLSKASRFGTKFGDVSLIDSLAHDGLTDAFIHQPMGITAENVAEVYHVSRAEQDAFALNSHRKATQAQAAHRFDDEIVPITVHTRKGDLTITEDASIRPDTSIEQLAKLKPAFEADGTVTAGNTAPMNDGASALILMRRSDAEAQGIPYLAELTHFVERGFEPDLMGYAPVPAVQKLLQQTNTAITDYDRIEINEAFASQSVAVARDLDIPTDRLNVNGGALALGHPIGSTGARLLVTLAHELNRENLHTGLTSMCIGGGMATAYTLTR